MLKKKLELNKTTISNLSNLNMKVVKGGASLDSVCGPSQCCKNTDETQCVSECVWLCDTATCVTCNTAATICPDTTVITGYTVCSCGC